MKLFFSPAGERLSTDLPQRRELSGKRILITGAAKGIGAGIAEVFAENGADLLLHYRSSPEEAEALKTRLSAFGGAIHLCRADLGTKEGIETLFAEADRVFGGLDAAVNNAGWDPGYMALEDITFESYEKLTSMNIRGTLFCCLNEIRRMRRNTPPGGSIVNIGSVQMETSVRGRTLYAASKGAIHSMTGQLSLECGKDHIRINAIAPGYIEVARMTEAPGFNREEIADGIPVGRLGEPRDIGEMALFLVSGRSTFLSGQTIIVDGGVSRKLARGAKV